MKKLRLDLNELRLETFTTEEPLPGQGTVLGNSLPTLPFCTRFGCESSDCPSVPCTLPEYFCPIPLPPEGS
jgi:hypothetical protein